MADPLAQEHGGLDRALAVILGRPILDAGIENHRGGAFVHVLLLRPFYEDFADIA